MLHYFTQKVPLSPYIYFAHVYVHKLPDKSLDFV